MSESEEDKTQNDGPTLPVPQEKLDAVVKDIPQPKQQEVRHFIEEVSMAVFDRTAGPKIDPDVVKMLVASTDKDNEFKFRYLSQKAEYDAQERQRADAFALTLHQDRQKMLWPIVIAILAVAVGGIITGIYLAATGHETLGASILTTVISGLLGYIAGMGTGNPLKKK